MKKTDPLIIVEQTFYSPIEIVWTAITNLAEMHQWYFDNIPDFKAEIGFKTEFNVKSEDRNFLHQWEITEVEPNKIITYIWQFKEYPGKALVTFELSRKENVTKLQLTNKVVEDFPQDIPEFKRESCIGGWQYFINQRLVDYLKSGSN